METDPLPPAFASMGFSEVNQAAFVPLFVAEETGNAFRKMTPEIAVWLVRNVIIVRRTAVGQFGMRYEIS